MIWFTSDLHLGHKNILKYCQARGNMFKDIYDMDTTFINTINRYVHENDSLWILGDFAREPGPYLKRIKCKSISLMLGNHDKFAVCKQLLYAHNLQGVYSDPRTVSYSNLTFFLSHYAHVVWPGKPQGVIHLYGHSHGKLEERLNEFEPNRQSLGIGIDEALYYFDEFRPISLNDIFGHFTSS